MGQPCWLVILLISHVRAEVKTWQHSNDYDKHSHWVGERLPCPGQDVRMPAEIVFMPRTVVMGTLYLAEGWYTLFLECLLIIHSEECWFFPRTVLLTFSLNLPLKENLLQDVFLQLATQQYTSLLNTDHGLIHLAGSLQVLPPTLTPTRSPACMTRWSSPLTWPTRCPY